MTFYLHRNVLYISPHPVVPSHSIQSIHPSTFVDILLFTFLPSKGESPSARPDILNTDITSSDGLCQTGGLEQRSDQTKTNIVNQSFGILLWKGVLTLLDEKTAVLGTHTLVICCMILKGIFSLLLPPYIRGNRKYHQDTGCPQDILPDCYHS